MIRLLAESNRLGVVTTKPVLFAVPILRRIGLDSFFEIVEGVDPDSSEPKAVTL